MMNLRRILFLLAFAMPCVVLLGRNRVLPPRPCLPLPTPQQMAWQRMEQYAFLHFSINTYTDQEWGYGDEPASLFNPSRLDARQWARVCKQSGMQGVILTAKHHCGFCLWPSQYTDYSVSHSPWRDGQGDVVRELAEACRAEGLKFGIYLSPWDRNRADYGQASYVDYFRNQLRELLTQYGDVFEIWFDGANGGDGYYGGARERREIDKRTYYQWPETYRMARELQPDVVLWGDDGELADLRWVGTEQGFVGQPNWSLLRRSVALDFNQRHHGREDGDAWVVGEVDVSIRPGWFYHQNEDDKVKTLAQLKDIYYKSVGRNATLLLNFPITPDGLIAAPDSLAGSEFGRFLQEAFRRDLARGARVVASNVRGGEKRYAARKVVDGKENTYWATDDSVRTASLTLHLRRPERIGTVLLQEPVQMGQRIKRFQLEALVDGQWKALKDQLLEEGDSLTTIGYKRIVTFPAIEASAVRITVLDSRACPLLQRIGLF